MPTRAVVVLFFLLFSAALLSGQLPCRPHPYRFTYFDRSSGLASARVNSVTQDHLGFWWLATEAGLQRFNGHSFRTFRHQPGDSTSLPEGAVGLVYADRKQRLWVAASSGLSRYIPETDGFVACRVQGEQVPTPTNLLEDSRGNLWLTSSGENGLFRLRAGSETWERCALPEKYSILGRNIWEDPNTGNIWVMYKSPEQPARIGYIDRRSGRLRPGPAIVDSLVRDACHFVLDQDGCLWSSRIAENWAPEYLFRYELATGQIRRYDMHVLSFSPLFMDKKGRVWFFSEADGQFGYFERHQDQPTIFCWPEWMDGYRKLSTAIHQIYEDREGNIWLATLDGVFVFNPSSPGFLPVFESGKGEKAEKIKPVLSVWESPDGKIWVGTWENGAFVFDAHFRQTKKLFTPIPDEYDAPEGIPEVTPNILWSFCADGEGNVWAGGQEGVLIQFSPSGELLWKGRPEALDYQTVRSLARDSDGFLWVGTQGGILARIDPEHRTVSQVENKSPYSKALKRLLNILPDKDGWLWLVYADHILYYHTQSGGFELVRFSDEQEIKPGKGYDRFGAAMHWGEDSLFIQGGSLYWLDKKSKTLGKVGQTHNLPSLASRLAVRSGDDLVLALSEGVVRWSPRTGKTVLYTRRDGLPDNFAEVPNVACRLSDGRIAIGMEYEGLYVFHPERMRRADTRPPGVRIDGLRVKGKSVPISPYSPLKTLRLRHSENFLTVAYACLTLAQQHHLRFRYHLKGYSRDWVDNGSKRSVELTGLSPGRYVLEIQVRNREGLEAARPAQFSIHILPPWYLSWPAVLAYCLVFAWSVFRLYRFQIHRKLERVESERLRQMDAFKTQFYTNITHEFRTPLTVIQGMARQVREKPEKYFASGLELIRRNSERLLDLVNQVLELSRLESGSLALQLRHGDLVPFIRYVCESYNSLAKMRDIEFHIACEAESVPTDFDPEKTQTALSNLLSNALRFTPAGGRIDMSIAVVDRVWAVFAKEAVHEKYLRIAVSDTGPGIIPEELEHIFERYYQVVDSAAGGTGIGLTLARELARLMGGEITVESTPGSGSVFMLWLPVQRTPGVAPFQWAPPPLPAPDEAFPEAHAEDTREAGTPVLLLVEDSPDVLYYLRACLEGIYVLRSARDGREALQIAAEAIPDLIISDIMMPEMDGLELCAALKGDIRTSHIPVILLTAKAGSAHKIKGLEQGADEYLVKPFEKEELLARIAQLLAQRARLQEYYRGVALRSEAHNTTPAAPEDAFLIQVRAVVQSRLSDADFGASALEQAMGMSHAQFYRKMDALLGYSASVLIRRMRVEKAKELLERSTLNISEVSYLVGFSDPGYFSKVFKAETGVPPNEWGKK